jgi:hypothetical protein
MKTIKKAIRTAFKKNAITLLESYGFALVPKNDLWYKEHYELRGNDNRFACHVPTDEPSNLLYLHGRFEKPNDLSGHTGKYNFYAMEQNDVEIALRELDFHLFQVSESLGIDN